MGGLSRSWEFEGTDSMVGAGQQSYQLKEGLRITNIRDVVHGLRLELSDSRDTGVTEHYDTDHFFRDTLRIYTPSEKVPRYRI